MPCWVYINFVWVCFYSFEVFYDNVEDAYRDSRSTDILGYIYFPRNFSTSMQSLMEDGRFADDSAVNNAELAVHIDMTGKFKRRSFFLLKG